MSHEQHVTKQLESTKRDFADLGAKSRVQPALGSHDMEADTAQEDTNLLKIKETCIHNAKVCQQLDESGKEGVWKLLTQMVDRKLQEKFDPFNGWSTALGVDLVGNMMRYYEHLGDVQMLATMVCVLRGGRRQQFHLLPTGQDEKYDAYIHHYADLLYGWGKLVKRAELLKHLATSLHPSEGKVLNQDGSNSGRTPGIAIVFACPQCGKDAEIGNNVCQMCQDFIFKCSICEIGVRGMFTV